jgi:H+-transporting ATPase
MAEPVTHGSNTSEETPPNHLDHEVPSGGLHDPEKAGQHPEGTAPTTTKPEGTPIEEDGEDEDIDALIDDLESQDGHLEEEEEEVTAPGGARPVAEELLQTDTRHGLTTAEVEQRRKKYGLNQMSEDKENLILKFLMYFVGPIQFVMEVSHPFFSHLSELRQFAFLASLIFRPTTNTHAKHSSRSIGQLEIL